jgi:hypothetical protein
VRIVVLALAAVPFLAPPALAGKPFVPLAPVVTNKDFCAPDRHPVTRVLDGPSLCCTEAGGCAEALATSKVERRALAGKL